MTKDEIDQEIINKAHSSSINLLTAHVNRTARSAYMRGAKFGMELERKRILELLKSNKDIPKEFEELFQKHFSDILA